MPLVRIKEKGQVTLPAKIRERRGLHTGDYMEVQEEGNRIVLIPQEIAPRHPEIDKAIADHREKTGMSPDAVPDWIRKQPEQFIDAVVATKLDATTDTERLEKHLHLVGLPTTIDEIPGHRPTPDDLLAHMRHDKKAKGGALTFVLSRGIGHAFLHHEVPLDAVRAIL